MCGTASLTKVLKDEKSKKVLTVCLSHFQNFRVLVKVKIHGLTLRLMDTSTYEKKLEHSLALIEHSFSS